MLRRLRGRPRAPLAIGGLLAVPLFFSALLAFTLALQQPHVTIVHRAGKTVAHYAQAPASTEAAIWLLALVPPLALVAIGVAGVLVPYGRFLVPVAAVVDALALTHRLDFWAARHTVRYPFGIDLIRDSSNSSVLTRGQWERDAVWASRSLAHWTIGLALAAIAIALVIDARRRRGRAREAAVPASPPSG